MDVGSGVGAGVGIRSWEEAEAVEANWELSGAGSSLPPARRIMSTVMPTISAKANRTQTIHGGPLRRLGRRKGEPPRRKT